MRKEEKWKELILAADVCSQHSLWHPYNHSFTIQSSKGPYLVAQSNREIRHVTWGLRGQGMASKWTSSYTDRRECCPYIIKIFIREKWNYAIPWTKINLKAQHWLFWLQIFCSTITYCLEYYLLSDYKWLDHSHQFLPQPHPSSPSCFLYKTLNTHYLDPNIIINFDNLVLGIVMGLDHPKLYLQLQASIHIHLIMNLNDSVVLGC